jgi:hypothetical protein
MALVRAGDDNLRCICENRSVHCLYDACDINLAPLGLHNSRFNNHPLVRLCRSTVIKIKVCGDGHFLRSVENSLDDKRVSYAKLQV